MGAIVSRGTDGNIDTRESIGTLTIIEGVPILKSGCYVPAMLRQKCPLHSVNQLLNYINSDCHTHLLSFSLCLSIYGIHECK